MINMEEEKREIFYDAGQGIHYYMDTFEIMEVEFVYEPDRS